MAAARELIAAGSSARSPTRGSTSLSDYAAHPDGALSWRFQRARGGNGVLGDLASHGVDLVRYLLGEVDSVVADTAIFIPERPVPTGATSGHQLASGGQREPVENEDYVFAQLRLASGARCSVEASRVSVGEQNAYGFEIHGTTGILVGWDFRRIGELRVGTGSAFQDQPVTTRYVGPGDGDYAAFQPASAMAMGYDELKVIEAHRFLQSIETSSAVGATISDAVATAQVIEAISTSVRTGGWEKPQSVQPEPRVPRCHPWRPASPPPQARFRRICPGRPGQGRGPASSSCMTRWG